MSRFVDVPADRLVDMLEREIGHAVSRRGGSFDWDVRGRERVFNLWPPGHRAVVQIYTTIPRGGTRARARGKDAIRIVVMATEPVDFQPVKPIGASQKILRTAPARDDERTRVAIFLERLKGEIRAAYRRAQEVRTCRLCGKPMRPIEGSRGRFLGCTGYPQCQHTADIT